VPPPIGFWPLALAWAYMTPQASGGEAPHTKRGSGGRHRCSGARPGRDVLLPSSHSTSTDVHLLGRCFRMVGSRWPHTGSPPARQRQRCRWFGSPSAALATSHFCNLLLCRAFHGVGMV